MDRYLFTFIKGNEVDSLLTKKKNGNQWTGNAYIENEKEGYDARWVSSLHLVRPYGRLLSPLSAAKVVFK